MCERVCVSVCVCEIAVLAPLELQWTNGGIPGKTLGYPLFSTICSSGQRPNIFMDAYSLATVGRLHCSHAAVEVTNLAERQSIRNTIKSSQSEKFYAAAAAATAYFPSTPPKKPHGPTKKLCKKCRKSDEKKVSQTAKFAGARWELPLSGKIGEGGKGKWEKGHHKSATTNNFVCHIWGGAFPFLISFFFFCLRRGLKTFNNAPKLPSDFFHIINLVLRSRLMWSGHQWRSSDYFSATATEQPEEGNSQLFQH